MASEPPAIVAVSASAGHGFSKAGRDRIRLLDGLGVEGDAHCGATVKHRSRVAADPAQANLRQVHLLEAELLDWLNRDFREDDRLSIKKALSHSEFSFGIDKKTGRASHLEKLIV